MIAQEGKALSFWQDAKIPGGLDVGQTDWFESLDDVKTRTAREAKALQGAKGDRKLAALMQDCLDGHYSCGLPSCAVCMREYRRWLTAQMLRLNRHAESRCVATIYLCKVPVGELAAVSLSDLHGALRGTLRRAGLGRAAVIGGTELNYDAQSSTWLLHIHALMLNAVPAQLEVLRKRLARRMKRALVVESLNDPIRQLSYCQKFATYHRPGRRDGARRQRAYPLPLAVRVEILRFYGAHEPDDFLFLQGVRRHGSRLKRLHRGT